MAATDQNLDTQLDKTGCDPIFQDNFPGISTSRLALDEIQSKLRKGDTVVAARFFLLGRSRDHLISLINEFKCLGIHFKAMDLSIDNMIPAGRIVLCIFSTLAKYDRKNILKNQGRADLGSSKMQAHRKTKRDQHRTVWKSKKAMERGQQVNGIAIVYWRDFQADILLFNKNSSYWHGVR